MPFSLCRIFPPALLLAMIAGVVTSASARADDLPEIHYVAGRFPPYTQVDASNVAAGPTAALIEALGKRIGRPRPLSVLPFARAMTVAEHDSNTLIALVARSPERERKFQWVCQVLDYDVSMFRRHDRPDIVASRLPEMSQWRIGGVNRDMKTEFLQRLGIPMQMAADEDEATRLLVRGRIDALPGHPATIRMRLREMGEREDVLVPMLPVPELNTRLYLAFSPNTAQSVVALVAETCRGMIASGEVAKLMRPAL